MRVLIVVSTRSTFFFPGVPLPLLEMCQAVDTKQRDGAVILVGVMRMEVDAYVPIKVANRRRRVERLSKQTNSHSIT